MNTSKAVGKQKYSDDYSTVKQKVCSNDRKAVFYPEHSSSDVIEIMQRRIIAAEKKFLVAGHHADHELICQAITGSPARTFDISNTDSSVKKLEDFIHQNTKMKNGVLCITGGDFLQFSAKRK